MRNITLFIIATLLLGCTTPSPYSWQDTRQPARDDATADLKRCQDYAARQYRPGIPMGEPYLKDQAGDQSTSKTEGMDDNRHGEWRPDRSPFPTTNINAQPIHKVPVDYTGYPGELDYYPSYLDDILEKCMQDHGWRYLPPATYSNKNPHSNKVQVHKMNNQQMQQGGAQ
jgi:hypothetical protein